MEQLTRLLHVLLPPKEVSVMNATKYPVVLVHGMITKDFRFLHAFRCIADFLRQQNITVYITNQDGVGAVSTNAQQLKDEILEILQKEHCDKVNLIAHSKGGVDARYMISCLNMAEHIATLTTLSTPHHGSGLSARLLKMPHFMAKCIAGFSNITFRLLGDKQPDLYQLGLDMTPEAMEQFNETCPNHPSVYYQSFSSTAPDKKAFLRHIPYQISRHCEQDDTDGMVSVSSSKWGNYRGSVGGNIDHFQMVGTYGSKKKLMGVGLFYLHIVQELQSMGF